MFEFEVLVKSGRQEFTFTYQQHMVALKRFKIRKRFWERLRTQNVQTLKTGKKLGHSEDAFLLLCRQLRKKNTYTITNPLLSCNTYGKIFFKGLNSYKLYYPLFDCAAVRATKIK